jgi:cytochrome c biogenesis protein CcdA
MLKKLLQKFIRIIQKILITVSLTVVYFIGLGVTLIFVALFNRKILTNCSKEDYTFWVTASGYQPDIEDSLRQS